MLGEQVRQPYSNAGKVKSNENALARKVLADYGVDFRENDVLMMSNPRDRIKGNKYNGGQEIHQDSTFLKVVPHWVVFTALENAPSGGETRLASGQHLLNSIPLPMDSLIIEGRSYLKIGGEILFIATSKSGSRLTARLMEKHWGKGIQNSGEDPLDYSINWEERGVANWAVVSRLDIPLKDYHQEFVPIYEQLAQKEKESSPFIKLDGQLYQKLYFIRAKKN